jgi:hypothetical protein
VWRPLSQRIRESAPIRLIADNRIVRRIADKPVTKAPTRRQTVLIGLIPALAAFACLSSFVVLVAFNRDTFGLGLIAIAILLLGGLFIGARLRSVICTLLATGLFFVFIRFSAHVVDDYVLETRGEEVTAVVVDTVRNPTGCASVSAFYSRGRPDSIATLVTRLDGSPLPGAIGFADNTHGNNHVYRKGERVQVLVDPGNAVCMRAKSDVHLVVDTITTVLALGCIVWVFIVAPLDWRVRRQAKYERWRAG